MSELEPTTPETPAAPAANFKLAIVRMPPPSAGGGLTTSSTERAEYRLLLQQHLSYTAVLRSLGLKIRKLPSLPEYPDSYFVEDVAVVTPEVAVIARPGAEARRGETKHIREALEEYRSLAEITEPGTLDGGDVMQIGRKFYIGLSSRTNEVGAAQLAEILEAFDYEVFTVPVPEGLHLKSAVNYIGRDTLLLTEAFAQHPLFADYEKVIVPPEEAPVANSLLVNDRVLSPVGFPETQNYLREMGFEVLEIHMSEAQKMDGGLSCMSLRLQ